MKAQATILTSDDMEAIEIHSLHITKAQRMLWFEQDNLDISSLINALTVCENQISNIIDKINVLEGGCNEI